MPEHKCLNVDFFLFAFCYPGFKTFLIVLTRDFSVEKNILEVTCVFNQSHRPFVTKISFGVNNNDNETRLPMFMAEVSEKVRCFRLQTVMGFHVTGSGSMNDNYFVASFPFSR